MGDIQIEVIGTTFNAQTYDNEHSISASLLTGEIKLHGIHLDKDYTLKPSEKFVYSKLDKTLKITTLNDEFELAWMRDRLVFQSEPLNAILRKIERWYGVTIDLQCPEIEDDLMSGSFYNEELNYVLAAIRIQYGINYQILGNHVNINKK